MLTELEKTRDLSETGEEYQAAVETYVKILATLLQPVNHRILRENFDKAVDVYFKAEAQDQTEGVGIHRAAVLQAAQQVINHPYLAKEFRQAIIDRKKSSTGPSMYAELAALFVTLGSD